MLDPGGVGQRLAPQLFGQRREQLGERSGPSGARSRRDPAEPADARAATASARRPAARDEVDGVADRLDLGRLLLGDADPVACPRAPSPARRGRASRRRGPPGTGLTRRSRRRSTSSSVDRCSRTFVHDVVAVRRFIIAPPSYHASRMSPRVVPERSSELRGALHRVAPRTAAGRQPDRVGDPLGAGAAVPDDRDAPQAEEDRAAGACRGPSRGEGRRAPAAAAARPRRPRGPERAAARTASATALAVPSIVFSTTLPVKPSVTITSASPLEQVAALDVADEVDRLRPPRGSSWASTTSARALLLLPRRPRAGATRGLSTPRTAALKAEPR